MSCDFPISAYVESTPLSMEAKEHTCSVCLEVFSEPKVLPCCHTFCLKCLEKTARSAQRKGEITCPQCRKTHTIPSSGMTGFLTDFIASHEIEVEQLKSPTAPKPVNNASVCGECEEVGHLEHYCCDCQNYLCPSCVQAHKKLRAYRGHKAIPIEELNVATLQSSQVQYCTTHRDEALKLFCETCPTLVCRDCTLVEHRDHKYIFVQDARKKMTDHLNMLSQEVKRKLSMFQANLREIQKVGSTSTGYSEVLKADVNNFFDKLVQSIEARRKQLLKQVEVECQKDLKQIWADKDFHQSTISQISSAFGLTNKALKCTNDVEMVLTALHSIHQLTQLTETEWESEAFVCLLSTQAAFKRNMKQEISEVGNLYCPREDGGIAPQIPQSVELGRILTFNIRNNKALVDFRSGRQVKLQGTKSREIGVSITYGLSKKVLDTENITITENSYGISEVAVRLVCGGVHTITITIGEKPAKGSPFVVKVEGVPKVGDRVTKGPDWSCGTLHQHMGARGLQLGGTSAWGQNTEEEPSSGVVCNVYENKRKYKSANQPTGPIVKDYTVRVNWNHFSHNHVWGASEGCYEIELL